MRFGVCIPIGQVEQAAKAGFDYIEPTVVSLQPESPESEIMPLLRILEHAPLRAEAFNVFLPREVRVTGPDVDEARQRRYVREAMARVARCGGEVIVFGSAGARNLPEGFPREQGRQQIVEFLLRAAEYAARHDIVIAIEPLNSAESNIINSVQEAAEYAQAVDHPAVRVLADFYHIQQAKLPVEDVLHAGRTLAHAHTADSGRYAPGTGDWDQGAFLQALRTIGYNGRVSVECTWRDFDAEAPGAVALLRQKS